MMPLLIGCFLWGILLDSAFIYYVSLEGDDPFVVLQYSWIATVAASVLVVVSLLIRRFRFGKEPYRQAPELVALFSAIATALVPWYSVSWSLMLIAACGAGIIAFRARLLVGVSVMAMAVAIAIPYKLMMFGEGEDLDVLVPLGILVLAYAVSLITGKYAFRSRARYVPAPK